MNTNNGWLDIASAPKDFSTEFDGWNGERVPNVIWAHPEYGLKGEYAWCRSVYEPHHGWSMERVKGLTHWMPLPAAPGSPASTVADEGAKSSWLDEAQRLAQALFQRHFSQDDDYVSGRVKWEVLEDIPGVLSQIDNMVSGLVQPAAPAAGDTRAWQGLTDAERDGYVGELVDYGTDFVAPLYSVVESIEKRLREKNAASQQGGE